MLLFLCIDIFEAYFRKWRQLLLKLKTRAHYIVVDNAALIKNIRQTSKCSNALQKKLACYHAS